MNLDWHAHRSDLPELATLDQLAGDEPIDLAAVRSYRLGRVREQLAAHSLDACILLDPVNIRYLAEGLETIDEIRPAITAGDEDAPPAVDRRRVPETAAAVELRGCRRACLRRRWC